MKISNTSKTATSAKSGKASQTKQKSSLSRFRMNTESATGALSLVEVFSPTAILSLQSLENETGGGGELAAVLRLDKEILHALTDLQVKVLEGTFDRATLVKLETFLQSSPLRPLAPEVEVLHRMILQRVSIELAKLQNTAHSV